MNRITIENEDAAKKVLNYVFDNFDFEQVKKTMDALDWKWDGLERADLSGKEAPKRIVGFYTPTLDEIKAKAAQLMWECANEDIDVLSTCGFRVEKDFTDPDDPWMRLAFEVTDCDALFSETI